MQSVDLLVWLEKNIGFETYHQLGDRSLGRIAPFFSQDINSLQSSGIKVITVAGTNGKGQTCYSIAEILKKVGCSYSIFLSPHIHCITERFGTSDKIITTNFLFEIFQSLYKRMYVTKIKLSYFEFLFAAFLEINKANKYDVMILEVGVGGRLDATNLIDTDVAVITSISRDHQDLLGKRLDTILNEKMGITREKKPLLTAFKSDYLRNKCRELANIKSCIHQDFYQHITTQYGNSYEIRNKFLAVMAVAEIKHEYLLSLEEIKKFLVLDQQLPGRGETLQIEKQIYHFYGSHNLEGIREWIYADVLQRPDTNYDDVLISFSKRSWQDIEAIIKLWIQSHSKHKQKYKRLIISFFEHLKAFQPSEEESHKINSLVAQYSQSIKVLSNWKEYNRFPKINKNTNILVIGSFYFVSEVRAYYNSTLF